MSTLSAVDTQGRTPSVKAVHVGDQSILVESSFSATLTASSIIKLVQLPNGAQLEDFMWSGGPGDGSGTFVVGTSASPSCVLTATSFSALANGRGVMGASVLPYRVSLSDDAQPLTQWVQLKVKAVGTSYSAGGGKFKARLTYRLDE